MSHVCPCNASHCRPSLCFVGWVGGWVGGVGVASTTCESWVGQVWALSVVCQCVLTTPVIPVRPAHSVGGREGGWVGHGNDGRVGEVQGPLLSLVCPYEPSPLLCVVVKPVSPVQSILAFCWVGQLGWGGVGLGQGGVPPTHPRVGWVRRGRWVPPIIRG